LGREWKEKEKEQRQQQHGENGESRGGRGSAQGGGGDGEVAVGRVQGQLNRLSGSDGMGKGRMGRLGKVYLHGRVLAFLLLGIARPRESGRVGVVVRLMRLGLKVSRDCVGR
jgi:hypothetical protein